VAAWLNSVGMTVIILKYRCPRRRGVVRGEPPLGPQLDAQRAVSLVRSRVAEWGINPKRIGMVGFSAGGHLALATATGFANRTYEPIDAIDRVSCRPDFAILCYSGYLKAKGKDEISPGLRIPANTPPIFLAHASDDGESYGRALVTLLALDVAANTAFKNPTVYAYASPRTGDPAFVSMYNQVVTDSFRIANRLDLVPKLPSSLVRGVWRPCIPARSNMHSLISEVSWLLACGEAGRAAA